MAVREEMRQQTGVAIALKRTSKATGNLMKEVAQLFLMRVEMVKMEQGTELVGLPEVTLNHSRDHSHLMQEHS